VRCYLRLQAARIAAAEFRVFGCPHTRAVAAALAAALAGQPLAEAQVGSPADWAARHAVPRGKLGRLLVVEDAWQRAREAALASATC
jgi:NifU-like protein involved in Fe-S cluster formation